MRMPTRNFSNTLALLGYKGIHYHSVNVCSVNANQIQIFEYLVHNPTTIICIADCYFFYSFPFEWLSVLYKSVGGNLENLFQSGLITTNTRTFVHVIDFNFHKHWLKQFSPAYITVQSLCLEWIFLQTVLCFC